MNRIFVIEVDYGEGWKAWSKTAWRNRWKARRYLRQLNSSLRYEGKLRIREYVDPSTDFVAARDRNGFVTEKAVN